MDVSAGGLTEAMNIMIVRPWFSLVQGLEEACGGQTTP
jgi:hypothetical protein